jgi:hypothetical protein
VSVPDPVSGSLDTFGAIIVSNDASQLQQAWIFCAMPAAQQQLVRNKIGERGWLTNADHDFPFVLVDGGLRVLVACPSGATLKLWFTMRGREAQEFAWHPSITADLFAIIPTFLCDGEAAATTLVFDSGNEAVQVWRIDYRFARHRITGKCWFTVNSGLSPIEFANQTVYGDTTNDRQAPLKVMPEITMVTRARIISDHWKRNGQARASWNAGTWTLPLVLAGTRVLRAARWPTRGALLPMPDVRSEQLPMRFGIYTKWEGHFLAARKIPKETPDLRPWLRTIRQQYLAQVSENYGEARNMHMLRPRAQQPNAGQTGEQIEFGFQTNLALVTQEPWELEDALWQCQAYELRPTANREPSGDIMRAINHPRAETYGQRPDGNFGPDDRLGWPVRDEQDPNLRLPYFPGDAWAWSTEDDQHRCGLLLMATLLLTDDPALRSVVEDRVQLDATDIMVKQPRWQSPRAIGRLTLDRTNQVLLGWRGQEEVIRRTVEAQLNASPLRTLPLKPMRTIGAYEDAKHGWTETSGAAVKGVPVWQEPIAIVPIALAAPHVGQTNWIAEMQTVARAVLPFVRPGLDGRLMLAYAVRWQNGDLPTEAQWPLPSWLDRNGEAHTDTVYISPAADYWTLSTFLLLTEAQREVLPAAAKAWLAAPRTAAHARWWAF